MSILSCIKKGCRNGNTFGPPVSNKNLVALRILQEPVRMMMHLLNSIHSLHRHNNTEHSGCSRGLRKQCPSIVGLATGAVLQTIGDTILPLAA
eukprot:5937582-Amphidinium_carterae.2